MVPPYPYCIEEDRHDVPMEDCWYARPQLFFTCVLRPKDGRLPKNRTYTTGPADMIYTLVFFSTFEELILPINGPMQDAGVIKLYEPSQAPSSTWPMSRIWWAEFLLSCCFWPVTRLQQSRTCSVSARIQAFRMALPTRLQRTHGGAAMSTRSTWQAPPGKPDHRADLKEEGCCEQCTAQACSRESTSSQLRFAKRLQPDSKYMVLFDSIYEYVRVCTSMYEYVSV